MRRRRKSARISAKPKTFASVVASPAPKVVSRGKGPTPKMSPMARSALTMFAAIATSIGVRTSPMPRKKAETAKIPRMKKAPAMRMRE